MLTIWGRLNSHNVKKVAWFAQEIGLPFIRHDVGREHGMSDAYRALNPNTLIPTIDDDGFVLWESNAILRYLAARYAPETMYPTDPAMRAAGDKWMDWQFSFADAQRDLFVNLVRRRPADRDMAAVAASAAKAGEAMQILDAALAAQPWLSGLAFGVADVPMGVYAHTFFGLDIERPAVPHVRAWYDRLRDRSGYAETVMIPLS